MQAPLEHVVLVTLLAKAGRRRVFAGQSVLLFCVMFAVHFPNSLFSDAQMYSSNHSYKSTLALVFFFLFPSFFVYSSPVPSLRILLLRTNFAAQNFPLYTVSTLAVTHTG